MNLPTLQCIVPGSPWARRNTRQACQGHETVAWQSGFFFFGHRLRETAPTENEPTAGRSGAPPASLAGICLSEPSKTLIWTEIEYLFYSIVLPNIIYGLSVYGASEAEINVLQQFLDRSYKLRFISTQLNIRSLLQKQDKAIFQKAKQHDNHPLKVCLPQEKNNLTYNLRRKSFQRPKINTERYKNTFVNRLIFKYNLS